MLCIPTNVAAANCHALLPVSSHFGDGTSIEFSPVFFRTRQSSQPPVPRAGGRMSGPSEVGRQEPCQPQNPTESSAKPGISGAGNASCIEIRQIRSIRSSPLGGPIPAFMWIECAAGFAEERGFGYGSAHGNLGRNQVPQPSAGGGDSRADGFGRAGDQRIRAGG